MIRVIRPLHDWQRHYPTARRIASQLSPDLLRLRSATLAGDVCARFGVGRATAYTAIGIARRAA